MAGTTQAADVLLPGDAPANGAAGQRAPRSVRRARGVPRGRAVLGGLLVAVAVVGTFSAYGDATSGPSTAYAVATRPLPVGHVVSAGDLDLSAMDLPTAVADRAFTSPDAVVGAVTVAPVGDGELVQAGMLRPGAAGAPAAAQLSFAVPADRALNGRLQPGERVDVLATYGTGTAAHTAVVARGALLLADDEGDASIGASTRVLTVAVDDGDTVLALAHAVRAGEVTVVRAGVGDGAAPAAGDYRPPAGGNGGDGGG